MATGLSTDLSRIMNAATRACETACNTRFAPFTGLVESVRMQDVDVEDLIPASMPMPMQAQMGLDYARALTTSPLVRGFEVRVHPRQYPDLWLNGTSGNGAQNITQIAINWNVQPAPFIVPANGIQFFPDTGVGVFVLGTFVPPGSMATITYSGGYSTVPDDLKQACLDMAASMIARMLDPNDGLHDPDVLRREALMKLEDYGGPAVRLRP